jgi:serine protease Do
MHFPRLPDWLIYLAVVIALAVAALGRQEHSNALPRRRRLTPAAR